MPLSLHQALIPSFRQVVGAMEGLVDKAEAFAAERGRDPAELAGARLAPDMLPFSWQIKFVHGHSLGAIEGVRRGTFSPDRSPPPADLQALRALMRDTAAGLDALDPAELDALADRPMRFEMGEMRLPFTGEGFLLSFSQPNFYFHAATAYDILRAEGVKLEKRDFLGRLRLAA
ncbi:DUF1993 domain-containing protein [Sphingomonas lenta]|uniref:DUF1993 domain-containing protein n=1 Tax=Sphingomonas lenta TaxID=1141887 RepID=A0A2A2SEK5_9SPHN|nr:DUF1993 domain-containing protein [Sphingomonas lenta]PAX07451.1 hypothetical protein CKY28_07220 [Sphingomonas lenta]